MILILTMAGQYQRFKEKGFNIPKYLLPWGERTVLSELLNQFNTNKDFTQIFLIANLRDQVYMPHVHSIMRANKINSENLLLIGDTKGQAETAIIGLKLIEKMLGNVSMQEIGNKFKVNFKTTMPILMYSNQMQKTIAMFY